jgi:hypothetical protein
MTDVVQRHGYASPISRFAVIAARVIRKLRALRRRDRIRQGRRGAVIAAITEHLDSRILSDIGIDDHEQWVVRRGLDPLLSLPPK